MASAAPRDTTAFEVRDALRESGCAICRLSLRSVERQLKAIAYEQVNDLALRAALRSGGGFCNAHAYHWLRSAQSVLGTALIYKDVLEATLRELDGNPAPAANGQRKRLLRGLLGNMSRDAATCPGCQAQLEAEARYGDVLLTLLATDPPTRDALEASDGLCRRHVLAAVRSGRESAEHISRQTRRRLETLLADLDEVIRKEDYRFRHEDRTEGERTAPSRAVSWAAGIAGLTDAGRR